MGRATMRFEPWLAQSRIRCGRTAVRAPLCLHGSPSFRTLFLGVSRPPIAFCICCPPPRGIIGPIHFLILPQRLLRTADPDASGLFAIFRREYVTGKALRQVWNSDKHSDRALLEDCVDKVVDGLYDVSARISRLRFDDMLGEHHQLRPGTSIEAAYKKIGIYPWRCHAAAALPLSRRRLSGCFRYYQIHVYRTVKDDSLLESLFVESEFARGHSRAATVT